MSADYLDQGIIELPACGGRTWFDAIVEGWHDQGMMRQHMEGLHELDLERARQRPVLAVTLPSAAGPLQFLADPEAQTVAFRVPGSGPLLPEGGWSIGPGETTAWLPGFGPAEEQP